MSNIFESIKKKLLLSLIKKRFESKVKHQSGHWAWSGHISKVTGKPQFWYDGQVHPAQRISWLLYHGSVPSPGQTVRSTCGHKDCVNPEHLSLGSKPSRLRGPEKDNKAK